MATREQDLLPFDDPDLPSMYEICSALASARSPSWAPSEVVYATPPEALLRDCLSPLTFDLADFEPAVISDLAPPPSPGLAIVPSGAALDALAPSGMAAPSGSVLLTPWPGLRSSTWPSGDPSGLVSHQPHQRPSALDHPPPLSVPTAATHGLADPALGYEPLGYDPPSLGPARLSPYGTALGHQPLGGLSPHGPALTYNHSPHELGFDPLRSIDPAPATLLATDPPRVTGFDFNSATRDDVIAKLEALRRRTASVWSFTDKEVKIKWKGTEVRPAIMCFHADCVDACCRRRDAS